MSALDEMQEVQDSWAVTQTGPLDHAAALLRTIARRFGLGSIEMQVRPDGRVEITADDGRGFNAFTDHADLLPHGALPPPSVSMLRRVETLAKGPDHGSR